MSIFVPALLVVLSSIIPIARGIESPQHTVVHSESDFEIRLYRGSAWMSAPSDDISFDKATKLGFHRIRMTTPVLTSVVPDAGPLHSSAYVVRLYLPVKFQSSPPVPLPELKLHLAEWAPWCIAVRKFSGFARDNNIVKEAQKLALSLSRSPWADATGFNGTNAYSIAQYNSPFRFIGRINEVWVDLDGSKVKGCESSLVDVF